MLALYSLSNVVRYQCMLKFTAHFTILAASLLLATSCHHDDTSPATCFPGQITSVTTYPGGQTITSTTTFSYDSKMNLLGIQDDHGALTFTYTDGRITSAQSTASQTIETWSYNSNGLLSHVAGNSMTGSMVTYTYTEDYSYSSAGDLTTIEWNYTNPSTFTVDQTFVSSNGNASYQVAVRNGHDVVDSVNYSAYDSKRSTTASIAQALGKQKFYFVSSVTTASAISKNNPTIQYDNGKVTLAYEYNTSGYPSKITITDDSGNVTVATVTYTNCK